VLAAASILLDGIAAAVAAPAAVFKKSFLDNFILIVFLKNRIV
jgi:hypothetical protein